LGLRGFYASRALLGRTLRRLFRFLNPNPLLDRHHIRRSISAESLPVQLLDEHGQRRLPRLLVSVVQLAKLLGMWPTNQN
jgi:hypothetical protein